MSFTITLCLALLLDTLLGDPEGLPHPVAGVGRLIGFWEGRLYPAAGTGILKFRRGLIFCGAVLLSTALVIFLALWAVSGSPFLTAAAQVYFLYAALAWRSLKDETLTVALALFRRNLPGARTALARVVGRDTENLSEPAIVRAAVETVAENSVDGVFSVLFFAALGYALQGAVGMVLSVWLFKAASTLDSMVGYDDERYHDFGRASARLDDVLNFIPARVAGLVIILAGVCLGAGLFPPLRVFLRDRKKHRSPNSAHGESAFAGVLSLRLGGGAAYGGKWEPRPWLGDETEREIEPADILRAHKLLDTSVALFALLTLVLLGKV